MPAEATTELHCWKEHTCVYCGTRYRYLLKRQIKGRGQIDQAALESAVLETMKHQVKQFACPECGALQPEMIRARLLWLITDLLLTATGLLILGVVMPLVGTVGDRVTVYVLGGLGVAIALGAVVFALGNPNADPEANRRRSLQAVVEGQLQSAPPGGPRLDPPGFRGQFLTLPLCLALAAGALLPFGAEMFRSRQGWPVNSGWSPEVIGPGDYTWVRFPDSGLESVKAYWTANSAAAQVVNAAELGLPAAGLKAESRNQHWGESISVKGGEKSQSLRPWCGVYLPSDPQLAGKSMTIQMRLNIAFPALMGEKSYEDRSTDAAHTATVMLSSPGAGATYRTVWCLTSVLGFGLLAFVLGLAYFRLHQLSALALPTHVLLRPAPLDPVSAWV